MKKLVGKLAALVGIFSHSAVINDALRAIQKELTLTQEPDALLKLKLQAAVEQEGERQRMKRTKMRGRKTRPSRPPRPGLGDQKGVS